MYLKCVKIRIVLEVIEVISDKQIILFIDEVISEKKLN